MLIALGNFPDIEEDVKDFLREVADVEVAYGYLNEDQLIERIKDVNAVILGAPRLTQRVILAAEKLEIIARRGIGVDNIDIPTASKRGVVVTNVLDVLTQTVVEHAIMLMLAVSRRIVVADVSVRKGRWEEFNKVLSPELEGKTLGIVGLGSIGTSIANIARTSFRMKIITSQNPHLKIDRAKRARAEVLSLDELLKNSDYLLLAVPLTTETKTLIGKRELGLMKKAAFLINVARGQVVDEDALYLALKDGKLAGAGLDVLSKHPPNPGNPLLKLENVVFTPHCAGLTIDASRNLSTLCVKAIIDLFRGKIPEPPVNVLNPQVAENYLKAKLPG